MEGTRGCRMIRALLILVATGSTVACDADDEIQAEADASVQRDSSGVRIVENARPNWRDGLPVPWGVDPASELVIGSAPLLTDSRDADGGNGGPITLSRVHSVRVFPDGRLVVADAGTEQVMIFDRTGTLMARVGARGDGPGEYRRVADVHICGEDSVAIGDGVNVHFFDGRGEFVRRVGYRIDGSSSSLVAVSTDCRRVLVRQEAEPPPLDAWGPIESTFAWLDPTERADTVASEALTEFWTRALYGEIGTFGVPWGTIYAAAADGNDLVAGHGRAPEFRRYDASGRLTEIVRWGEWPQPIGREDRRHYAQQRAEWLEGMPDHPETRFWFPALDEYPELPSHKPLFDRLLADDRGRVWARVFPARSIGFLDSRLPDEPWPNQVWRVFDPAGVWLGELTLPERFDLQAVVRDRLYGILKDSLGVETVHVFAIILVRVQQIKLVTVRPHSLATLL